MFQAKQVADKKNTEKNEKRMKEIERKKQVHSLIATKYRLFPESLFLSSL